jgi:hypothetical protein
MLSALAVVAFCRYNAVSGAAKDVRKLKALPLLGKAPRLATALTIKPLCANPKRPCEFLAPYFHYYCTFPSLSRTSTAQLNSPCHYRPLPLHLSLSTFVSSDHNRAGPASCNLIILGIPSD